MLNRIDAFVLFVNRQAIMWLMGTMATMVFCNVLLRYFHGSSILWAEETSRYLMIWATFLGSGLLFRQGAHIAVDNLQNVVPEAAAKVVRFAIVSILMLFFISMIYVGSTYAAFQWHQQTPVTRISFGLVYAALPAGFLLMSYHTMMVARTWIGERRFDQHDIGQVFGD